MWHLQKLLASRRATKAAKLENELKVIREREQRVKDICKFYQSAYRKLALDNRELRAELHGVKSTVQMFLESTPLWPAVRSMMGDHRHDHR